MMSCLESRQIVTRPDAHRQGDVPVAAQGRERSLAFLMPDGGVTLDGLTNHGFLAPTGEGC